MHGKNSRCCSRLRRACWCSAPARRRPQRLRARTIRPLRAGHSRRRAVRLGNAGWRRWERAGRAVRWRHGWAPVHGAQPPAGAGCWIRADRFGARAPGGRIGSAATSREDTTVTAASSAVERLGALAGIRGRAALEHVPAALVAFTADPRARVERRRVLPAGVGVERRRAGMGGGGRARDRQARRARSARCGVPRHRRRRWRCGQRSRRSGPHAVQAPVLEVERTLVYVALVGNAARHRAARRGGADAGRGRSRRRARLRLRARDAPAARSLRPLRRPGGARPALPADRLLERARDLRGDDARHLHGGGHACPDAVDPDRRGRGAAARRVDALLHVQPRVDDGGGRSGSASAWRSIATGCARSPSPSRSTPWAVLTLADAHRRGALAHGGAGVHAASTQGRPLLVLIALCAAASAATMAAFGVIEQRVVIGDRRAPCIRRSPRRCGGRRAGRGGGDLWIAAAHGLARAPRARVQAAGARLRPEPAPRDAVA